MPEQGQDKHFTTATPAEVRQFHIRDDTDTDVQSHHHTLGMRRMQASPGDHVHDGKMCNKVGAGMNLVVFGARGGNAALLSLIQMLSSVITFTDNTTP